MAILIALAILYAALMSHRYWTLGADHARRCRIQSGIHPSCAHDPPELA